MKKEAPKFYKNLIKRSWKLTRSNKWLWFFGLFSAVLVGAAGEYNLLIDNVRKVSYKINVFYGFKNSFFAEGYFSEMVERFASVKDWMGVSFYPVVVLFVLLGIYTIWMILVSEPSIIYAANKFDSGDKTDFENSLAQGRKFIWPSAVLNFIGKIIVWLVLFGSEILFAYMFIESGRRSWLAIYLILSFIILLPLAIIISFVVKYALSFVVLKGEKIFKSFKLGWKLFFKNWLVSLELALIIFLVYFIVGLLLVVIIFLLSVPFIVLMYFGILYGSTALFWFVMTINLIIFFALIITVGSMMSCWQLSNWVLLFDHLTKGDRVKSGIIRWIESSSAAGKRK